MAERADSLVRSLDRALRALKLFTPEVQTLSVAEISTQLDIPLASTYRIVDTLVGHGFLRRDEATRGLRLGLHLIELGALVQLGLDVRAAARPVMQRLAQEIGETSVLVVPGTGVAVCVEVFEGSWPIRPRSVAVGERLPYDRGASGLALLAFLSEEQQAEAIAQVRGRGRRRVVEDEVRDRLAEVRASGYAYSREELLAGTAAVAAPIFSGGSPEAVASLALTGIVERIGGLEEAICSAAAAITEVLGGTPTSLSAPG